MPQLRNTRHELFALAVANGQSERDAYVSAGFHPHNSNPSRLAARERVRARINELTSRKALILTKSDVLNMLLEDRQGAKQAGQWATAVAVDKLVGQELHGMFSDRRELAVSVEYQTSADLLARVTKEFGENAAAWLAGDKLIEHQVAPSDSPSVHGPTELPNDINADNVP